MALVLPLAVPTYIVAYVYVGVARSRWAASRAAFAAMFGWRSRADYWFPEIRSLAGGDPAARLRALPLCLYDGAGALRGPERNLIEVARTLGARAAARCSARWRCRWRARRSRSGLSLALLETLNDIGASEYLGVRTLTVSIYTTWVNRGSLEGAAQIACVMLAVRGAHPAGSSGADAAARRYTAR